MGIAGIMGLTQHLEPYATRFSPENLDGCSAIVDGPSLAYHAHKLALDAARELPRIPSYADINSQAIR